jgi:hypothetical protein
MLTKEEIAKIVKTKIEKDEKLGDQAGGSGHLTFVSYKLTDIKTNEMKNGNLKATYVYTKFYESEFTYEPDNPPMEVTYKNTIVIDKNKKVVSETGKTITSSSMDDDFT